MVNETLVNTFWKDLNPIGQRLRPVLRRSRPGSRSIGVAKDVKQGGVDKKTGTEFYFLVDQTRATRRRSRSAPGTMNIVLRTTLPPAALAVGDRERRARSRSVGADRPPAATWTACSTSRSAARVCWRSCSAGSPAWRCCSPPSAPTACCRTWWRSAAARSASAWRSAPIAAGVLAQVMKQGLMLTTIGIVVGLAGAFALNRVIASLLFGVQPDRSDDDGAVVVTISLVATVACWLPAWRASRLDPNAVLRSD